MAPKRIVLHHDNSKNKEIELDFFSQSSSAVASSFPAVDLKKNVSSPYSLDALSLKKSSSVMFDCSSEQEDFLGLSLNYVVAEVQKEANVICNTSAKNSVVPHTALGSNFQIPSMDSDTFTGYPDDTDCKNDVKEYEAWKSRRERERKEEMHRTVVGKC